MIINGVFSHGNIYELDGTGITTSYQAGGLLASAKLNRRRYQIQAQLKSSSTNITGIKCKVSASADGINFVDIQSTDDVSGSTQVEQLYSTITNHVISGSFTVGLGYQFLHVSVKATGGTGQATESVIVYATDGAF